MNYTTIETRKEGPAFIITFNRPDKRNAISTVVMGELIAAADEADADAQIRGIIITGGNVELQACPGCPQLGSVK